MDYTDWTLFMSAAALAIGSLVFTYFQYTNKPGGSLKNRKRNVIIRSFGWSFGLSFALWLAGVIVLSIRSDSTILIVKVVDTSGDPVEGVQLSVRGSRSISSPSSADGVARIDVKPHIDPKSYVMLEVVHPAEWEVLTPPLSGIPLLAFGGGAVENAMPIRVFHKSNSALLNNQSFVLSLAERVVYPPESIMIYNPDVPLEARRSAALADVSKEFGLDASSIDGAIHNQLAESPEGSYEQAVYESYSADMERAKEALRRLRDIKEAEREYTYGRMLLDAGEYFESVDVFRGVQEIRPDDVKVLHALTAALFFADKLDEAERIARNSIALSTVQFGAEDLMTVRGEINLAAVLMVKGKFPEALPLLEEAHSDLARHLGPENREVLVALSNLALLHWLLGDLEKAEALQARALLKQEELWPREASTFQSMNTMAAILLGLGRCAEALDFAEQSLKGREQYLGNNHPELVSSINTLAAVMQLMRRYDDALVLVNRVLEQMAGNEDSPDFVIYRTNFAYLLRKNGDLGRSREILGDIISNQRALEAGHPYILNAKYHLAESLRMLRDFNTAWELQEEVLQGRSEILGSTHPETLETQAAQARILFDLGDLDAARELATKVLVLRREKLGPRHRDTVLSEWDILEILMASRDFDRAREVAKDLSWVLEVEKNILCGAQLDVRDDLPRILAELS